MAHIEPRKRYIELRAMPEAYRIPEGDISTKTFRRYVPAELDMCLLALDMSLRDSICAFGARFFTV